MAVAVVESLNMIQCIACPPEQNKSGRCREPWPLVEVRLYNLKAVN